MTIYDYKNRATEIELPDKEIETIVVIILSGDETGIVKFTDGEEIRFDASDHRLMDFYDGSYVVAGDNIEKWLNFKPESGHAAVDDRADLIWGAEA